MVEGKVISTGNVAYCLGMSSKKLHRWYKDVLSGYSEAVQSGETGKHDLHLSDKKYGVYDDIRVPIYKPENMGEAMGIDEKDIDGITYTILHNRKSSKIALMADTLEVKHLSTLLYSFENCMQVRSISRDMASNYDWLCREVFMNAYHVIDKFHVLKNAFEDLQAIRIRYRQEQLSLKREQGKDYVETWYSNGDTALQLLARSRGLLFKFPNEWTAHQKKRSQILFEHYPQIKQAYDQVLKLRVWYTFTSKNPNLYQYKFEKLNTWIQNTENLKIEEMKNLCNTIDNNKGQIMNYFIKGETNASAESLNSRIQRFIHINYGARNKDFFLFRLGKYFS